MLITIPDLLNAEQTRQCRQALESAAWTDGRQTAGHVATHLKTNRQLALDDPIGLRIGELLAQTLRRHPVFQSAALPARILPPRFNRYEGGEHYGFHIDNALFRAPGAEAPASGLLRTDISTTVFFSDPDEYEGGELIIQDTYGEQRVKLPAGHAVVYPGSSLHRVTPVTRGVRYGSFFWTQSLVRDDGRRTLLLQQDVAIQRLIQVGADPEIVAQLTGVYHNLLRMWSEP
ncbi:Fe2+-dependent dioxygenase [uncultured Castellaniella sp.]|mgnify:CR=1 FL=1|uniref:Fe2+-dependent dioxygenase n=1 Tax=uncultured Castellaniella sp. TaxID=647907 RepID=UPI0026279046|nr:Fe2+-dependent dioxygenase [uncultured Castellaniella sp.]